MMYFVVGVALLFIYVALVRWAAKQSVDKSPRAEMFVCDTHGPMPIGATMLLFDGDMDYSLHPESQTLRGPIRACPICFEQKIKHAQRTT